MTNYIIFPGVNGDNVFEPDIREAIADAPELEAKYAPISGSEHYVSATSVMALLASKLNASEKGSPLGIAILDANSKLLENNMPDRLSEASQRAAFVTHWKPNTFYPLGSAVLNPSGDVVTAKAAFTSDAEYNSSNWNLPSVDGGTP